MATGPDSHFRASILLVEDDLDICHALYDLLSYEGYHVESVHTGIEAIARARSEAFSAAILDLGLPDVDGAVVLTALTGIDPHLPVIILTAFTTEERTVEMLRQGAYAYLTKPYNREQIKATLSRAVGAKVLAARAERVERALTHSEERFQALVQSISDAVIGTDHRGFILSWNQAAHQLFGYAESDVVGKPFAALLAAPNDEHYAATAPSSSAFSMEGHGGHLRARRRDGSEFPAEIHVGQWKADDRIYFTCVLRDISARRNAQRVLARLAAIVESSTDAIISSTLEGEILTWNPGAERLYGYSAAAAIGRHLSFLMPSPISEEQAHWLGRLQQGQAVQSYETVHRRKDDDVVDVCLTVSPIQGAAGDMVATSIIVRDITVRKKTEAQLIRQQIEQQVLLDLIPAMVWYKDDHNRILRTNRLAAESINLSVGEVEGRSTYDLYPEEADQYYQDDLAVITSGRPKLGIIEVYRTASGDARWVQTDKVPYRDRDGTVMGVLVFSQDITDRRHAEEALQSSEARFRAFMENSPALAFMKDEEGHYLYVNIAWERCFNKTRADWYGKTDEEIWPPEMAVACRASDRQVLESNRPVEAVEQAPDANGILRYAWIVKFPIQSAAGHRWVGGLAQDITERKLADEALLQNKQNLEAIVDSCPAVIQVKDRQGRYVIVNHQWEALFHRHRREVVGMSVHQIFPKEIADVLWANDCRVLSTQRPLEVEETIALQDGPHVYRSLKFPLLDGAGQAYAVCGIATDITEPPRETR